FIEDIVQALELSGAIMLPKSIFLRATNNKVFMEKLRELYFPEQAVLFATQAFGCLDELTRAKIDAMEFPVIVKTAQGASGSGVFLAHDPSELLRVAKKVSRTRYIGEELWDIGRYFKHTGYRRESLYRKRFIVQKFIPGLKNDWKVYVFGSMYYIFFRPILKHRLFKASGGGYHNYAYGDQAQFPQGIFDYAKGIYDKLAVPHVSLDIAFDGQKFYLLEFQSLYFGTAGIINSNCYYSQKDGNTWAPRFKKNTIESVFAGSIHDFVMKEKDR
ncbi:MAG: hypothetical protein KKE00_09025, partial [Proteobacteria bacterium]|nr:hypothetical protein [Pseudomonadota bacterium]MBU1570640.1 hypothetical protein [Pseudomonadota bacterium]